MTSKKSKNSLKSEPNKLFCYSGNKEWFIDYANEIIDKDPREFESYVNREITYNRNGFDLNKFIDWLINLLIGLKDLIVVI